MASNDIERTREYLRREEEAAKRMFAPAPPERTAVVPAGPRPHTSTMADPITRSEMDAKLETIEAKMEGRLARIDDRLGGIEARLDNQKNTAWKAAGAVIATFAAVFAIYVAAFDSGRETAKLAAEAQKSVDTSLAEIRKIAEELKAARDAAAPTPPLKR